MNAAGPFWRTGSSSTEPLFENAFYATGYPIAEAYWATVSLSGVPTDVLIQCFERHTRQRARRPECLGNRVAGREYGFSNSGSVKLPVLQNRPEWRS